MLVLVFVVSSRKQLFSQRGRLGRYRPAVNLTVLLDRRKRYRKPLSLDVDR
jgi:hypothetical protein